MADEVFEVYQELWTAIHELVDHKIAALSPEDQQAIRLRLTEDFRFWKRLIPMRDEVN